MGISRKKTEPQFTPDVLAIHDKTLRVLRNRGYMDSFEDMCEEVFGVPIEQLRDSGGYNYRGFNEEGYNEKGFNRFGRDRDGYDRGGYNQEGYDLNGLDKFGFNREGISADGGDRFCYDIDGFDREGYSRYDGDRVSENRAWYKIQADKPAEAFRFDRRGNCRPGMENYEDPSEEDDYDEDDD